MTCEEVRERLPEHVLGTLEGTEDVEVRRHVRGCAGCRAEMAALGEGLTQFARAAHDRPPPDELQERVLTVLQEEWRQSPARDPARGRRWLGAVAVAAAVVALVVSLAWGVGEHRRASSFAAGATSYANLLHSLGGEDFRVGSLRASGPQQVDGDVVLYDAHSDQSWALVIVHAPGLTGSARATLSSTTGRTIAMHDLTFDEDGDASTWLVSYAGLKSFDKVTITSSGGTVLATAAIQRA